MSIRQAHAGDVPRILEMGIRFGTSTPYAKYLPLGDAVALRRFMHRLVAGEVGDVSDVLVVTGADVTQLAGMIGLFAYVHPMTDVFEAIEAFWWVEPEARGGTRGMRLLDAAEAWARSHECKVLRMIAPNAAIESLYVRCGYDRIETSYAKDLTMSKSKSSKGNTKPTPPTTKPTPPTRGPHPDQELPSGRPPARPDHQPVKPPPPDVSQPHPDQTLPTPPEAEPKG